MSKIDELRQRYPKLSQQTFDKFVNGDKTQSKKYLEYLIKTWLTSPKNHYYCPTTTQGLIDLVFQFDELLPYIVNKDIYSKEYSDLSYLRRIIAKAQEDKEEKTFVKDDNIHVIEENDEYILLTPITHRGSLKYGAQTKWCTASKSDPQVFKRYVKEGLLLYLIDKKGNKEKNFDKIALYSRYSNDAITGEITLYNSRDHEVCFNVLTSAKWSDQTILKLTTLFRIVFMREKKLKTSKDYVESFSELISTLNFEALSEHMRALDDNNKIDYNIEVKDKINHLVKSLNKINNGASTSTAN